MTVVLISDRRSDLDFLKRALAEHACPVDDLLGLRLSSLPTDRLRDSPPELVVLGVPSATRGADPLEAIDALPPSAPALLMIDADRASRLGRPLPPRVEGIVVRGAVSESELADAVARAVEDDGGGPGSGASGSRSAALARLRHTLRTISDGVLLTDARGEIIYVNPAAERILGGSASDILGLDCEDPRWDVRTLGGEPIPAGRRPVPRVLESGGEMESATYVLGRDSGGDVVVSVNASAMRGGDGEVVGAAASLRDVTDERRVREELAKTTRLLDAVVESVPDAIYAKDRAGRYLMMNSSGAALFDRTVDEVVGRTDDALFTEEDASQIREDDLQVMKAGRAVQFRDQSRTHDGEERFFDVTKAPLRQQEGSVDGVVGITRDITDRIRAEEARRISEQKYEKLFQATPLGIALSTMEDGRFLEVNDGFVQLLGYRRGELIGRRSRELGLWVDEGDRERLVRRIRTTGEARELDARLRRGDGAEIEAEIFGERVEVDDLRCIITVTRDVTERRRYEREIARSRDKLQQYAAHMTSARERERKELARDIHDHLGQLLTAVKLKVVALAKETSDGDGPSPEEFGAVVELVDRGVQEVRDLSTSLRPSAIDQFGLVDALRWQVERVEEQFGLDASVDSEVADLRLGEDQKIHVFRVVQEALTNVGRHADADRAVVAVDADEDSLLVRVLDDGVGVDPESIDPSDSHGLLGMEERAHLLGGELYLRDRPEGGAEVRLVIPYEEVDG